MPAPRVKPAGAADAAAVAELLHAFNQEFGDPTPGAVALAARIQPWLASGEIVAFMAADPGVGVAQLTFRPSVWSDGPTATLDELYVVPARRGEGWGRALLEASLAAARERGSEYFEVVTGTEDEQARRLYERNGLSRTEPGDSEPMLYYARTL